MRPQTACSGTQVALGTCGGHMGKTRKTLKVGWIRQPVQQHNLKTCESGHTEGEGAHPAGSAQAPPGKQMSRQKTAHPEKSFTDSGVYNLAVASAWCQRRSLPENCAHSIGLAKPHKRAGQTQGSAGKRTGSRKNKTQHNRQSGTPKADRETTRRQGEVGAGITNQNHQPGRLPGRKNRSTREGCSCTVAPKLLNLESGAANSKFKCCLSQQKDCV